MSWRWWRAALIRALKTVCQTTAALIPTTGLLIHEIPWLMIASSAAVAGLLSILTSIATGLPEDELEEELEARTKELDSVKTELKKVKEAHPNDYFGR